MPPATLEAVALELTVSRPSSDSLKNISLCQVCRRSHALQSTTQGLRRLPRHRSDGAGNECSDQAWSELSLGALGVTGNCS